MPTQFTCPKCGQKLTLTSSKPGDWLDCPNCEATVQIPGAAPPKPTPAARSATPAAAEDDLDFLASMPEKRSEASQSLWSDKRVQFGAIACRLGFTRSVSACHQSQSPRAKDKPQEQAHNDPPPAAATPLPPVRPLPPTPTVPLVPVTPVKPKDTTPTPPSISAEHGGLPRRQDRGEETVAACYDRECRVQARLRSRLRRCPPWPSRSTARSAVRNSR